MMKIFTETEWAQWRDSTNWFKKFVEDNREIMDSLKQNDIMDDKKVMLPYKVISDDGESAEPVYILMHKMVDKVRMIDDDEFDYDYRWVLILTWTDDKYKDQYIDITRLQSVQRELAVDDMIALNQNIFDLMEVAIFQLIAMNYSKIHNAKDWVYKFLHFNLCDDKSLPFRWQLTKTLDEITGSYGLNGIRCGEIVMTTEEVAKVVETAMNKHQCCAAIASHPRFMDFDAWAGEKINPL
jgi:hypothetical protein